MPAVGSPGGMFPRAQSADSANAVMISDIMCFMMFFPYMIVTKSEIRGSTSANPAHQYASPIEYIPPCMNSVKFCVIGASLNILPVYLSKYIPVPIAEVLKR